MGINDWKADEREETSAEFQASGKSTGFEKLHSADESLDENGADQNGESRTAKYGKQASEWFEHSAEDVRQFYNQADASIRAYVKQSPGRSLFMAGAVGLIIGAILRRR